MENKYTHFHTFHIYQNEINRNKRETADLKETRRLLQKAIKETDGPLKVTSECLFHREGRRVSISKKLNLFCYHVLFEISGNFHQSSILLFLLLGN